MIGYNICVGESRSEDGAIGHWVESDRSGDTEEDQKVETRSGMTFLGNSTELDTEFLKMRFAAALYHVRKVFDAEFNRVVEDLQLGAHICELPPPSQGEDESTGDLAGQDESASQSYPAEPPIRKRHGEHNQ